MTIFEILSPGNTMKEMVKKLKFYDHYSVEEYYIYNPETNDLAGFQRQNGELMVIEEIANWVSPLLGIRFELTPATLGVYYPDGQPFLTTVELAEQVQQEKRRAEMAEAENERLKALLAEAGIEV